MFGTFNCSGSGKQCASLKLIQPGVEYQFRIKNNLLASVDVRFGLINMSYTTGDDDFETLTSLFSNITIKNVYNSSKVLDRNSSLLSHSGNYYGVRWLAYGENLAKGAKGQSFNYGIGPVLSVQRYRKTLYYQVELGMGYHSWDVAKGFGPMARFCLGINLKRW